MPGDDRPASRSRGLSALRSMNVPATPRATGPSSLGEAGAVATAATPAADGVARGPRDAARHVTVPLLGASKGKKSARTSLRTEPGTADKFNKLNTFDVFSTHNAPAAARRGSDSATIAGTAAASAMAQRHGPDPRRAGSGLCRVRRADARASR